MTFTITDFLISLSITAIIIFAIKWGVQAGRHVCYSDGLSDWISDYVLGLSFVLLAVAPKGNGIKLNHILFI